jgi:porin
MQVRQGWNLYPTLQYVIHPGGGYVLDNGTPTPVRNAVVLGVRTAMKF